MSTTDIDMMLSCANCGKGEEDSNKLKKCGACLSVKYCSRECQISHRKQHKKICKRRAAELYDEKLFKEIEPEECPICMLPLPHETHTASFESCCGKVICGGCNYEMKMRGQKDICAFCREPRIILYKDHIKRVKKLMKKGNAQAFFAFGNEYIRGDKGTPENYQKAIEFWLKAGELGCAQAYYNLGQAFSEGKAERWMKIKASPTTNLQP